MITPDAARAFVREWIDAWNSHDVERILRHYADGVTYQSPFVVRLAGNVDGALQGKEALREYLAAGLAAYPELHFRLRGVYAGLAASSWSMTA